MKRSCHRQTTDLAFSVRRMISAVPVAVGRQEHDLGPRHVLLWHVPIGDYRFQTGTIGRRPFTAIPLRILSTRTFETLRESISGLAC